MNTFLVSCPIVLFHSIGTFSFFSVKSVVVVCYAGLFMLLSVISVVCYSKSVGMNTINNRLNIV